MGIRILKKILLGVAVLYALMVLADIFLRLAVLEPMVPRTEEQFQEHVSQFWPRQIAPAKGSKGVWRMVGLSDSFGIAGGKDNYHYLLQQALRQHLPGLEVVNLSGGAYEIPDELQFYERFGPRYDPDIVLHGFCVGNDFHLPPGDLLRYDKLLIRDRGWLVSLLPHQSLTVQLLHRMWTAPREKPRKEGAEGEGDGHGAFSVEEFLFVEYLRIHFFRKGPQNTKKLQRVLPVLDEVRKEVERHGATYVLVLLPSQIQVESALPAQLARRYKLNLKQDYDLEKPNKVLRQYCSSRGIFCLDLLDAFRGAGKSGGLFMLRNTHYNKRGNELAAQQISGFLKTIIRKPSSPGQP